MHTNKFLNATLGISVIILFFILLSYQSLLIEQLNRFQLSNILINFIAGFSFVCIIIFIGLFFKNKLQQDWHDLKQNHRHYFKKYLPYWLIALALMMISNFFLFFVVTEGDIAENEQLIRESFQKAPIFVYFSAVIIAPILEELVFRGAFYYIFQNKWLFVIISSLAFGAVHILGASDLTQLLFIIPYAIPGFAFALALYYSKNLYVPIALHFIHNGIIIALQIFVIMIGGDVLI